VAYADELRRQSEDRARIRAEVRDTLPDKQFVPYYQPKIRLDTGEIAGFEALLRWDHPDGVRSPGSIVPALEDPELSRALCAALLDRIIADMARWQSKGVPFGRIAFNASSSEFSGFDLASHLTWRLKAIGLSPSYLGVEVTEAVFLDGAADSIAATLAQLRAAGIEIALDDFGTGFASLTHLQDFPVDVIKIDQSFIRRLVTDADSRAITHAVLNLGRGLGKTVVAEGVETAEQALLLKAAGCDQVQGFYFARPMPAENLPKFVANWRGAEQIGALEKDAA
jgi:EAL domain-containing protein (putative c-di-GMP-specific phosphodiesterase class I)